MSRVAANTLANLGGSLWGAALSLAVIPFYIRYLGVEAYGVIGIATTMQVILSLSDFGISAALMREMARDWRSQEGIAAGRTALATLTTIYIPIAAALTAILVTSGPTIAEAWVRPASLSVQVTGTSLQLVGVAAGFQLISAFFAAGLLGLQRQVLANGISVIAVSIQAIGAILTIHLTGADVVAFFIWQAVASGITAVASAAAVFRVLPGRGTGLEFDAGVLRNRASFALGMSGIGLLSIVLTQADKVILSKILGLDEFGYYSLAAVISSSLKRLFGPLFSAVYPRLTEAARSGDREMLTRLYELACQAMSVVVLPSSMVLAVYSREIVFAWTGNMALADHLRWLVALMVAGNAFNGLANTPYALQLAFGWTRLSLMTNTIAVCFFLPSTYFLAAHWGGEGATVAWVALNIAYVAIQVPLMHRRLLPGRYRQWILNNSLYPTIGAAVPLIGVLPIVAIIGADRMAIAAVLLAAILLSTSISLLLCADLAAHVRRWLWRHGDRRA